MLISVAFKMADNILAKLGIESRYANITILNNVMGVDEFKIPYVKYLPSIISGDKTGAANELCEYVKLYCESTAFSKDYNEYRESNKPSPSSEPSPWDPESIKELREAAKTWDELSKDKSVSKSARDEYKEMADDAKKTLAEVEDPTPKKTKWLKDYPEDPTPLIQKRLEEYLALVATVDFNAQLTEPDEYKIRKFVNPKYESKSPQWKAIYRAGSEVNVVVTEFAKQWLAAGIKTGQSGFEVPVKQNSVADSPQNPENVNSTTVPNNSSDIEESLKSKAKGMLKTLKGKAVK